MASDSEHTMPTGSAVNVETVDNEPSSKRRRIHMTDVDIVEYEKTSEGSAALSNPSSLVKSNKDPNRGLYPRASWKAKPSYTQPAAPELKHDEGFKQEKNPAPKSAPEKFGLAYGFQKASTALNPQLPFLPSSQGSSSSQGSRNASPSKSHGFPSGHSPPRTYMKPKRSVLRSPIKKGKGSILYYSVPTTPLKDLEEACNLSPTKPSDTNCLTKQDASTRLFNAQSSANTAAKPKAKHTKKPKSKKEPKFNRDNAFLYSKMDTHPDPLSMGVKTSCVTIDSDSCDSDDGADCFERLPLEVIENIFCRLPILDLYLNLPSVCKDWRDIIYNEQFVPWKKKYFRIKMAESVNACEEYKDVIRLMHQHGMTSVPQYLTGLIKYMGSYKQPQAEISRSLEKHSKYSWAYDLMQERLQHCCNDDVPNPWCLITALCILAQSVQDISEVITCLLTGQSYLMAVDITECLYCVATFLLCFKNLKYDAVWTHMHYRVYYALYLFENESTHTSSQLQSIFKSSRGQQCLEKYGTTREMELTHEQLRIVKFDPKEGEFAKIVAFAGTGKTTTLLRYTKLRPQKRFLLLMFNKSVRDYAAAIFPPNVDCKTGHGLAFRPVGCRYASAGRGTFNGFGLKVGTIVKLVKPRKGISLYVQAKFILDTLSNFMCSADEMITTVHVPMTMLSEDGKRKDIDHAMQMKISEDAEYIWERMKNLTDTEAPMTHDGYLKLYQLRKPKLYNYEMILVDEAQDLTPAVYDIIARQRQPKILVGDPHQQIYSFRGAVNAMDLVEATHTFYLTQSFRFGPDIAFVANCALEFYKGEKKRSLIGNAKDSGILGDSVGQVAVITRTNYTLFQEAVKKCCYSDEPIKVAFVVGIDKFGFDVILCIYTLMLPPEQRKPEQALELRKSFIGRFASMGALEKYATQTQDHELLGKIRIVRSYNHTLPSLISGIRKKTVSIQTSAVVALSSNQFSMKVKTRAGCNRCIPKFNIEDEKQ